jgi:poly(A) polymerase
MEESGVLALLLPECETLDGLHDLRVSETLAGVGADPMLRLMALIDRSAPSVMAVSKRLRLSNAEADRLTMWAADNLPKIPGMTGVELRRTLYWHGKQAVVDRALTSGENVRDHLYAIRAWKRPEFPVGGDDALAAGLKGPQIGEALRALEEWWMGQDFQPEREELLARLEKNQ